MNPSRTAHSFPWVKLGVPALLLLFLSVAVGPWSPDDQGDPAGDLYRTSVAVIPPISDSQAGSTVLELDVVGEALVSEISTLLSGVPWLKVVPTSSVRPVAERGLSTRELMDTLNVEHLLQGTVSEEDGVLRLRIGHMDIDHDVETGTRFDVPVEDWLREQPAIAADVARSFLTEFGGGEAVTLIDLPEPGPGQQDFLAGNRFLGRRTPDAMRRAIDAYWTAIEKDSAYAPAYAQLASAYALALNYRYAIGLDEYAAAGLSEALATHAIALNPDGAAGYASRSYVRALVGAPTVNAAADIDRARRLEPNNPSVPSWSARVHTLQGDREQAFQEAVRAAELDKLGSGRQFAVAYQAFHMGRHEDAVDYSDRALALEPGLMLPRVTKARALVLLGRPGDCMEIDLGPHAGTRALCLWALGERSRARAIVDSLEATYDSDPIGDFTSVIVAEDLAVFHAYAGNAEAALEWIRIAYDRSPTGVELRVVESDLFDGVRNQSGFQFAVNRIRGELWERVRSAWRGPLVRPDVEQADGA